MLAPVLAQLESEYPEQLQVIFRHFPLIRRPSGEPLHDKAALAAQAAEAAGLQGQFWAMHDLLFGRQSEWAGLAREEFEDWLVGRAAELDLDAERFAADLTSEGLAALAEQAYQDGVELGLPGTPFLVINGKAYFSSSDYFSLHANVELELLAERQFTDCPPLVIDLLKQYSATLRTEKGDIVLELYPEEAPLAVNNFVFLAQNDWYDGLTFHRVLPGFVAQAGDPTGLGIGGPGYFFDLEISPNLKFDRPGVLAMANKGPGTNGSQFFITYGPEPDLYGRYTIFGQVTSGMQVVESLTARNPEQTYDLPPGDVILDVIIEEK